MMRHILHILAALLIASGLSAAEKAGFNLLSRRISVQNGLAGNTINQLVQTADGYIWMATNNGLTRYDGYSAVNYSSVSDDPRQHLEARLGRIICDERQQLLWMSTATYQNACYDLRQKRFVDWTGCHETRRQLNKLFLSPSGRGMFFYGNEQGVRRSQRHQEGSFSVTDYTLHGATLPSDNVLLLLEDSAHNIIMPTDNGLTMLTPDDNPRQFLKGTAFISAATDGQHTYLLSSEGEAIVLDTQGTETMRSRLPSPMGSVSKVNVSFVWQGRWMVFTPRGTFTMSTKNGVWSMGKPDESLSDGLDQGSLPGYHFVADREGCLIIFPDKAAAKKMQLIPNARFMDNRGRKFHIAADNEGRLFIATYGNGLFVWIPDTETIRHFTAEDPNPIIRTNYLVDCICDRGGCLWLGSEATGAYTLSVMTDATINYALPEPQHQGDWANAVSALAQKRNGNIIIGTREGGVYEYNLKTADMTKLDSRQSSVTGSFVDADGNMWFSTRGEGLLYNRQLYQKDDTLHYLPENKVGHICQDARGRIWVGSWDGGLLMTERPHEDLRLTFRQYLTADMNERRIRALQIDSQGLLYVGTNNGIYLLDTREANIADVSFRAYNTANGRFAHDEVFCLYLTGDTTLWVGAAGSGVLKCRVTPNGDISVLQRITTREGLANNNVYSIIEDGYGYLWVGTEEGISRINTVNNIVNTYQPSPVLQGNVATEDCVLRTREGQLLFGTNYGMVVITPTPSTRGNAAAGRTHITDLHINGTSIYRDERLLALLNDDNVRLEHTQNTLTVFYSNFDYDNTQASLYQYYLEGLETGWQPLTTSNHAEYSQLSPGTYVFHLRALSETNEWEEETTLHIVIRQPWYNTWWAWLAYLLLLALLGAYVYRNARDKIVLHQQMKLERQISTFRQQFFTHITHEFRTPLAIIKGAIDKLCQPASNTSATPNTEALQTARRGTTRLLRLVNMFMEFRKADTGNLRLSVQRADLVGFCKRLCHDFRTLAQQKDINATFTPFSREYLMLFDPGMVETIVYNLLSNAIKYTPQGGTVSVKLQLAVDETVRREVKITVEDSGPGISPTRHQALFQPFMQGMTSQGGMGIGLFTAHRMAEAHHGTLTYTPSTNLGGACFELTLPADDDAYDYSEFAEYNSPEALSPKPSSAPPLKGEGQRTSEAEEIIRQMQPEALNDLTIAVVEDDPDMMQQICTELGVYFHIDRYSNGLQGFEGIAALPPALVITDVMLPDMDGYEIVRRLKREPATATLPVIMLTALADDDHQIKAYKAGADDYMTKPCNWRLLVARVLQLIQLPTPKPSSDSPFKGEGQRTSESHTTKTCTSEFPHLLTSQADKVFWDKLQMFTAQHLSEADFTVDRLAQLMSMGRTKFYGRVKEMTGLSPNKYLIQLRMQKAADLLADGELNVSEVSYRVGFQDPSYFNKCFKAHYGVVPSKYQREESNS